MTSEAAEHTPLAVALNHASARSLEMITMRTGLTPSRLRACAGRAWHPAPWITRIIAEALHRDQHELFPHVQLDTARHNDGARR